MPKKIVNLFSRYFLETVSGWRIIHWMATAVVLWLSFLFFLPGDTFKLSPAYTYFADTMREERWAIAFLIVGVVGLMSGASTDLHLKIIGSMLLSIAHGVFATLLFLGAPLSTGSGTYAFIAIVTTLRLWRLVKVKSHDG